MKAPRLFLALFLVSLGAIPSLEAATIGSALQKRLATLAPADSAGQVIVAFNGDSGLTDQHLQVLSGVGLSAGYTLPTLGMVAVPAVTVAQVQALAADPAVRSISGNEPLQYFMHQARVVTGVDALQTDSALTTANGGMPVLGQGDFSVVVNDTGIDATHADLAFGQQVVQNVQVVTDDNTSNSVVTTGSTLNGFVPLVFLENVPDTDTHVGHGTHCAGIIGGTGVRSGGLYHGVAPGVKLIGCGSGAVEFILNALGGFEWSLANQARYHIRIISNSWGGGGAFDPNDPINLATKLAHDRNIIVVFAGGNAGPAPDTFNPYAKAPWVISVAAGTKEGGLASFSSRGTPREQRLGDSDPLNDYDAPTITAPGTGREFASDADKFTAAIVSTRAISNVVATGLTNDLEIPTAYLPFYTQISGTSMATPFVAGVVALMLDANPALTPDQVKQIIVDTATVMPGYADWEVGAGYINAWAAVDKVFNPGKTYASLAKSSYNAQVATNKAPEESFIIEYSPTATPGPDSSNARHFTVAAGVDTLEVAIEYGNTDLTLFGNILILKVYAPDGTTYANAGSVIFVTDTPRRYVRVLYPTPGDWVVEVRGARGLAAAPQASSPVALALPDTVGVFIDRTSLALSGVSDIAGNAYEGEIVHALKFRYLDVGTNGKFSPTQTVTRAGFADALRMNTPLRQAVHPATFTDVASAQQPLMQAVAASGSTLRHFDFAAGGLITPVGAQFKPSLALTRLELAVALVRALGQDADAQALAGTPVTVTNQSGEVIVVSDLLDIPSDKRGYVQLALNKSILAPIFGTLRTARFNPNGTLTRAELAAAVNSYRDFFALQ
ncbi:MAG: peptidase [Lacunisphaera sp.]|nr:peptidase [Lacunisphaera sp.]